MRGWLAALILSQFFLIATSLAGMRGVKLPASGIIATNLNGFLLVWSTLIIVISAGSVSLEADIISDSILSRACTRNQFIIAKLLARSVVILGIYLIAASTVAYAAYRYGLADVTLSTVISAIGIVGLALLMLVALGVLFSVLFNNTVVSVVALLLLWYVASPIFTFFGAEYLSPASLVRNLPTLLKDPHGPQLLQCSATEKSVRIVFSKQMDVDSAETVTNYEVECPPGTAVIPRAATYDKSKATVELSGLELAAGEMVRVRVRGVVDTGGTPVNEAANTLDCRVPGKAQARSQESRDARRPRDTTPPVLLRLSATRSSLRATFSEALDPETAEDVTNYRVENPVGRVHQPSSAVYDESRRSVLLTGLNLDLNLPVKLTVRDVKDEAGNRIRPRSNSLTYTEVSAWRYALGFGVPALVAAALAVLVFNRRDL